MLTDEQVRQEIVNARGDSDVYGLVEKIAYFLHLRTPKDSALINWSAAEDTLLRWSDSSDRLVLRADSSFGKQLHKLLEDRAYDKSQERSFFGNNSYIPDADWKTAQHELAKQVLWQQCKITVPLYPGEPFIS
jgi:hypothetical protein